jgi:hypothetical protein
MKISKTYIFISLIFFAAAGFLLYREVQFLSRAETVMGTVKTFEIPNAPEGGTSYCPLIEYTTQSGETFLFNTLICSNPAAYEPGQQVQVFYDPQDPANRRADSLLGKYPWTLGAVVLGLFIVLVGLIDSRVRSFIQRLK